MLFRNDQKYKLTAADFKAIAIVIGCSNKGEGFEDFPKGGVNILPPKPTFHVNADGSKTINKPSFSIIPYEQSLDDKDEGTVKWNYCTRPPVIKPGESPKYEGDQDRLLTHRFAVMQNQPDLLFYLCCISRCGSHHPNANVISYVIENKKAEAMQNNNKRVQKVDVEAALFHKATQLHDMDVARIAKAMRISDVEAMTPDEVRDALITRIEVMEASTAKDGYSTFLSYIDSTSPLGSRAEMLANLQVLKDRGIIKWQAMSHNWIVVDENKKKVADICSLVAGRDKDESLEHHVVTNPEKGDLIAKLMQDPRATAPAPQQ